MSFSDYVNNKEDPKLETNNHPNSDITAIIDLDFVKYSVAGVGEKRSIIAKHKASDREKSFDNRTAFWGRGKNIGGWLGEQNESRIEKGLEPFSKDDFEIEDVQKVEPIGNVLHSAKQMVLSALEALGTDKYECYIGKGDSFRVGLSTLMEYKGQRKDLLKPLLLEEVTNYLIRTFKPEIITGIEVDDKVVMEAYNNPNAVIVGVDKDYRGQPVRFFDVNNPDEGIISGDCFGELIDKGNKISGYGRVFMYWQMLAGDSSDNYKANCFSETKYGDKKAFNELKDCEDDKEALEKVIEVFKKLYPESIEAKDWRGNTIEINWQYVANEMFQMARMLRWEGDYMHFNQWCYEYGVKF